MDLAFTNSSVLEDTFDGFKALSEIRHAKFLKFSSWNVYVEIFTFSKSLTENFWLMWCRKNSLGLLTLGSESSHSFSVGSDVNSRLLLECWDAEVDHNVVEIFSTQVSITICGFDFKNTVINGKQRHVKCASTKVENENVLLTVALLF